MGVVARFALCLVVWRVLIVVCCCSFGVVCCLLYDGCCVLLFVAVCCMLYVGRWLRLSVIVSCVLFAVVRCVLFSGCWLFFHCCVVRVDVCSRRLSVVCSFLVCDRCLLLVRRFALSVGCCLSGILRCLILCV